jgi:hypothetical protein
MIKHKFTNEDWTAIKLTYNNDGTRKVYPPRKGVMQGEYYQKAWYSDNVVDYKNFDSKKYSAYKSNKGIINALAKEKYGIVLKDDILYLKKVVGGLMVDETKARTLKAKVKLSDLKNKSLKEQLTIVENLFNSD